MIRIKVCTILLIILILGGAKRVQQCELDDMETATQEPVFITVCALIGVGIGTWNVLASGATLTDKLTREYNEKRFALELPNVIDAAYEDPPLVANTWSELPLVVAKKALTIVPGINGIPRELYPFDVYVKAESTAVSLVSAYLHCQNEHILRALQHVMANIKKMQDHGYVKEPLTESDGDGWEIANKGFEFVDGFANELVELDFMNSASLISWIAAEAAKKFVEHGMKDATIVQKISKLRVSETVTWWSSGLGLALATLATFLDPSGLSITALALGFIGTGEEIIQKAMEDKAWEEVYCPVIAKYASAKGNWDHTPKEVAFALLTPLEALAKRFHHGVYLTPRGRRLTQLTQLEREKIAALPDVGKATAAAA